MIQDLMHESMVHNWFEKMEGYGYGGICKHSSSMADCAAVYDVTLWRGMALIGRCIDRGPQRRLACPAHNTATALTLHIPCRDVSRVAMTYQYNPLTQPNHEIRVAVLLPGRFNDDLRIRFVTYDLRRGCKYEALSYVWGSGESPSRVTVVSDSQPLVILTTGNLDIALRHLRRRWRMRYVWIDALCINQKDDREKSIQVANMGSVYANAYRTISWLGPEHSNSHGGIEILREIARNVDVDWELESLQPSQSSVKTHVTFLTRKNKKLKKARAARWGAISDTMPWLAHEADWVLALLQRTYFERLWIQQEIQLSKNIVFQCGFDTFAENVLWSSILCLHWKQYECPQSFHQDTALFRVHEIGYRRQKTIDITYSDLRFHMREFQCSDPRDKIYAALGLLGPTDKTLCVRPDYSANAQSIFTDIAKRKIEVQHTLELLEACELATNLVGVPSWVPDWSTRPMNSTLMPCRWSACGFISAGPPVFLDASKYVASGMLIAEVSGTTEHSFRMGTQTVEYLAAFFQAIKPSATEMNGDYITGESIIEVYCRTLIMDDFRTGSPTDVPLDHGIRYVRAMWSTQPSLNDPAISTLPGTYIRRMVNCLFGRCFVTTADGLIGLGPSGARTGDTVCILLGCVHPVILRPVLSPSNQCEWLVVGVCYMHGLMGGEAVYRYKHASQYKPAQRYVADDQLIDNRPVTLVDSETGTMRTDPAKLLEDAGIKVESYQREPHRLFVFPETLEAAGIHLRDFVLV